MDSVGGAPSFPIPILVAVTALLAIPLYLAARGLRGDAARFLIGAIWLRYILSVFHVITYRDFGAGLSLTAVGSILVTGFGLLIIDKRYLLLKALLPVYALILIALASAQLNAGMFTALRSEEHTSELQSLMRSSYAVFCLTKKKTNKNLSR